MKRIIGYDIDGTLGVDRYPRIKRFAIRVKWGWLYRWCAVRMDQRFFAVHYTGEPFVIITARNPVKMSGVTLRWLESIFPFERPQVHFVGHKLDFSKDYHKQVARLKAKVIRRAGVTHYYEDEPQIALGLKRLVSGCRVFLVDGYGVRPTIEIVKGCER